MQLVYEVNNEPVQIGDVTETFRGESVVVLGIVKPHKPSSTGRVYVKPTESDGCGQEFFPSVINAKWIDREDQREQDHEIEMYIAMKYMK
jgi:hypothetical protein